MRNHKGAILATVCAAVLAINLDTTIVNVALPSISRELSAGTRQLQWVVDGYNLAFAGLVLAAGSLSDRFGRRPALIVGLVGFALASAAGALVHSADALVVARFAMGTFAALIFPTTLSIISNTFRERRERAAALGIWGAVVGSRRRDRTDHRRLSARALLLGQRVLGPGAAGPGDRRRRRRVRARVARPVGAGSRRPGPRPVGRDARDPDLHDHRGPPAGLVVVRHRRRLPRYGAAARRLRALGASHAAPDARPHAVPRPQVQRGQRCRDDHLLRAVRVHLPGHAVLPVRPRLRHALDRRAHPAGGAEHRGRVGRGCRAGAPDRDQDRGDQRARPVRCGLPVDLHVHRRHVVPPRDRAADGARWVWAWA